MIKVEDIQRIIIEDKCSDKKKMARKGQEYYDGDHDIKDYRLFYYTDEDRKSTRLNSSHLIVTLLSRMPSSA